jgi:flagellar motor protein MotB
MKSAPIIMKTTTTTTTTKSPLLDANGKPILDANGKPIFVDENGNQFDEAGNPINKGLQQGQQGQGIQGQGIQGQGIQGLQARPVAADSEEHKKILEKEKVIEDLLRQYTQQTQAAVANGSTTEQDAQKKNVAIDFFMKMMKTYFALILKFGDTVANSVIRITMPAQIANPIISDTPLNIADLVKTADRVNQVLANPEFKTELGHMFENTSNAVNPQIKMLLNKMADIFGDVAEKAGSKLANTAAITVSGAFPPLAVVFDIANLISVGINAVTSGVDAVSTAAKSGAKVVGAFNSTPSLNIDKYMDKTTESRPAANKTTETMPAVVANNKTKKQKGGGSLSDAGKQLIHDIGGDFIIETGEKIKNVFYNVREDIKPKYEEMKEKVRKYTMSREQKGGAKRTRRAIARIKKTLKSFK